MSTSSRIFLITTVVVAGFFAGFSAANIAYYNKIRNGQAASISSDEALTMLIINVILLIIAIVIFLWGIFVAVFSASAREKLTTYVTAAPAQAYEYIKAAPGQAVEYLKAPATGFVTLDSFNPVTGGVTPA